MKTVLVIVAMITFAADPTWEIELTTGEVLRGQLVEQTDDAVVFEHPVLGRLTIPAGSVASLRELPDRRKSLPPNKASFWLLEITQTTRN